MQTVEFEKYLQNKQGELSLLLKQQSNAADELQELTELYEHVFNAQDVLRRTAQQAQQQIEFHISDFVSSALETVWEDTAYTFTLKFELKNNKTVVEMFLNRDGVIVGLKNPNLIRGGGGVLDVIGFALRIALWSLLVPHKHVMILDQPFQNVDNVYIEKVGELLNEMSEKLELQFLIINHNPLLAMLAQKTFEVVKTEKGSEVKVL